MEPLSFEHFKPWPDQPHYKVRVSDGETSIELDAVAASLPEEELRWLLDHYRELGA